MDMQIRDGGIETLTPSADAQQARLARGRKIFAGGWLILKPPYGIGNYTHTPSMDLDWMERKGFKPIMQGRVSGPEQDIERLLRHAADNAKGFSKEEREHMRAGADFIAQNKIDRAASAARIPETESERLARIISEGNEGLAEAIVQAVAKVVAGAKNEEPTEPRGKK